MREYFVGRKKSKGGKYGGMFMTSGLAIGAMMLQLALGKIAFLAGAALLMAKMALIFSTLVIRFFEMTYNY